MQDIRALCFIVALQYEWELDFLPSNASFAELKLSTGQRARATQEAWMVFAEGLNAGRHLLAVPFEPEARVSGRLSLGFVEDPDDRVIIRDAVAEQADALLTSDYHILEHKWRLRHIGVNAMRPAEWLTEFLARVKPPDEDAVDWLERILFSVGQGTM